MYIPETLSSNKWGLVLALIWARWRADTPEEFWRTDINRAQVLDQLL